MGCIARVSRKAAIRKTEIPTALPEYIYPNHIYQVAIYIRLSIEDSCYTGDGESIVMQRYMLENYVANHSDMRLYGVFCDNGKTGTDFERSGFERMMEEIRQRNVDCIVVKDLSRFGRNYVEVGYYLEKIFPYLGVRFVAVNDQYDTLDKKNGNELVFSLKNLVNDLYAKDISKKISSAIAVKQKNGEFIGALPPYGYLKSSEDKHKLVIDPQAAPVVRDIFQWRLEGLGLMQIARLLNQKEVPSPAMYHYQKGHRKKKPSEIGSIWNAYGIQRLIQNPVYAGHMAQRKYKKSLSDGLPNTRIKREEWVVVEHTHKAIIDPKTFEKVQKISEQRYKESCAKRRKSHENSVKYGRFHATENVLKGVLICADCGTKMIRHGRENSSGEADYTFLCRIYRENLDKQGCIRKSVREAELKECMVRTLCMITEVTGTFERVCQQLQNRIKIQEWNRIRKEQIRQIQQKIKRNITMRNILFEAYSEHTITEAEYLFTKGEYQEEEEKMKEQILEVEREEQRVESSFSSQKEWIMALKKCQSENVVTRNMVAEMVLCIRVYGDRRIEIVWNFRDEMVHL